MVGLLPHAAYAASSAAQSPALSLPVTPAAEQPAAAGRAHESRRQHAAHSAEALRMPTGCGVDLRLLFPPGWCAGARRAP